MNHDKIVFKSHPLMIITELGRLFYLFLVSLLSNISNLKEIYQSIKEKEALEIFAKLRGESLWFFAILSLILFFYLFYTWRKWHLTTYTLTNNSLSIFINRIHKNELTLAKKDISNINRSQTLLQRICGLYQIAINTNTSITSGNTDVKIFLKKEQAIWLEQELKNINSSEIETESDDEIFCYEKKYTKKELLYHCFLSTSWYRLGLSILAFTIILCVNLVNYSFNIAPPEFWMELQTFTKGYFTLGLFLTMLWFTFFNNIMLFIKLYNFSLKKSKDKIYLSHGLIKEKSYVLPLEKIQGLVLKQHGFARILGFSSLEAINIGFDDEKNEIPILLLYSPNSKINSLMKIIVDDHQPNFPIKQQSKTTFWLYILKALPFLTLLTAFIFYFISIPYAYISLIYWIYKLNLVYWDYRTKGFNLNNDYLQFETGKYEKTTYYIKTSFVEQIELKSAPLERIFKKTFPKIFIMGSDNYLKVISDFGYYNKTDLHSLIHLIKK